MKKVGVFLRAINLAGKRLLMADFKRALADAGHPDAQTVVATGNAVILAKASNVALEAKIEKGLETTLGQSTEVFVRDGKDLAAILAGNPFPQMARDDPSHLVVVFLKGEPDDDEGREVAEDRPGTGRRELQREAPSAWPRMHGRTTLSYVKYASLEVMSPPDFDVT